MDRSLKFVILGVAAIIAILVIMLTFRSGSAPQASPTPTPEETLYSGVSAFYNQGLSETQVEDVKFAFYRFFSQTKQRVNQVAISNVEHRIDRNVGVNTIAFTAALDNKAVYQGSIHVIDINSIQLTLTQNGHQVFDSGVVKVDPSH